MSPSRRFLLAIALSLATALALPAQPTTGGIAGVVRDESGAVVPGATVTVTDPRTGGIARIVLTGSNGAFFVPNLSAGLYFLSAELKGFGRAAGNVRVSAGANMKADVTLTTKREEAVTVTGTRVKGRTSTETLAPVDVIDGDAMKLDGMVATGFAGHTTLSPDRSELYVATTYYPRLSRGERTDVVDIYDPATLDWQPIVKIEHYRLRQDSVKHPVELKEDAPPYRTGGAT